VLAGPAFAAVVLAPVLAFAQEHPAPPANVPAQPAAQPAQPVAAQPVAQPAAQPVAAQPVAQPAAPTPAAHEAAHPPTAHAPGGPAAAGHAAPGASGHEGGGHAAGHEGGEHHGPGKFNFADLPRFTAEKDAAAKGEPVTPVTPYAYLLVNFALLVYLYVRMGKKPVQESLDARRATVAKELEEAEQIKAEASAKLAEYKEKLAQLDDELARIREELIKTGEADRDRMVKEAEEKAERMKKDAQFLLDQEVKQLRNELLVHTVEIAATAAQKALEGKITAADHDRFASEYLDALAKPTGASASASSSGQGGAS
jgi:F-type H+-transporting ATPase subunit b